MYIKMSTFTICKIRSSLGLYVLFLLSRNEKKKRRWTSLCMGKLIVSLNSYKTHLANLWTYGLISYIVIEHWKQLRHKYCVLQNNKIHDNKDNIRLLPESNFPLWTTNYSTGIKISQTFYGPLGPLVVKKYKGPQFFSGQLCVV